MSRIRENQPIIIAIAGVSFAALGLVLQTFAGTAGLYCFTLGVVLILAFIAMKVFELNREDHS
ncbi:MAG TPA: hypothetical protein VFI27_16885 [candidate division Zixibacteria bacterium]|nr:hypothetical protein [candidate division Zixibacteria bacterium]